MGLVDTWGVIEKGIGAPDYSNTVSSSKERRGLKLEHLQTLKIFTIVFSSEAYACFYCGVQFATQAALLAHIADAHPGMPPVLNPYVWVRGPLAPGASASLIDMDTGVSMPFNVPLGCTATLIDFGMGVTQDAIMWTYIAGFVITNAGVYPGGNTYYENRIQSTSTALIDPTGIFAPGIELRVTNLGVADLEGEIGVSGYLEEVGTPPLPLVKTVRCKWCGYKYTVPNETTRITCPKCGKLSIVYDLSKVKKTG